MVPFDGFSATNGAKIQEKWSVVQEDSKGVCEHNTIIANTFSGIVVSSKSSPTIKNKVHAKRYRVWGKKALSGDE